MTKKMTKKTPTIRASSLPRVRVCPVSRFTPEIEIRSHSVPAITGTCVHEILADTIKSGEPEILESGPFLKPYFLRYPEVDSKEIYRLMHTGLKFLREFLPHVEILSIEDELKSDNIIGHIDILARILSGQYDGWMTVVDWKSGRVEREYLDQLMGYAKLARDNFPNVEFKGVLLILVWLNIGRVDDPVVISPSDLESWESDLKEDLKRTEKCPTEFCTYCPAQFECRERQALVRNTISDIADLTNKDKDIVDIDDALEIYPLYELARKAVNRYHLLVKDFMRIYERKEISGDREIVLNVSKSRKMKVSTDFLQIVSHVLGYDGLEPLFQDFQKFEVLSLGKENLIKLIRSKVPKGKGAEFIRIIEDEMEKIDGFVETESERISVRKIVRKEDKDGKEGKE